MNMIDGASAAATHGVEALETPILFLVYRRPVETKLVLERIRAARPKRLYIAGDGPRANDPREAQLVLGVRDLVMSSIDWPCDVKTLFGSENLGCRRSVSSAISWFFEHEEAGIILEDDCLPTLGFFEFCRVMLDWYGGDTRIWQISGRNNLGVWDEKRHSYHFSIYGGCWGWATWRRAWRFFDVEMADWRFPDAKEALSSVIMNDYQYQERVRLCDSVFRGEIDSWSYIWTFCRISQYGLSIVPAVNMVRNIGFGGDATHTLAGDMHSDRVFQGDPSFPLRRRKLVYPDRRYDELLTGRPAPRASFPRRVVRRLRRIIAPGRA